MPTQLFEYGGLPAEPSPPASELAAGLSLPQAANISIHAHSTERVARPKNLGCQAWNTPMILYQMGAWRSEKHAFSGQLLTPMAADVAASALALDASLHGRAAVSGARRTGSAVDRTLPQRVLARDQAAGVRLQQAPRLDALHDARWLTL